MTTITIKDISRIAQYMANAMQKPVWIHYGEDRELMVSTSRPKKFIRKVHPNDR